VDFAPTFLELANVPVPPDMQGRSLVPILKGARPADWRTSMYYRYYHDPGHHHTPAHLGLRTTTHKLIHYWKKDAWEMFDLKEDPMEQKNLADDPAQRAKLDALRTELKQLQRELKDDGRFSEQIPPDGVDRDFPNHGQLGEKTVAEAIRYALSPKEPASR
jgi:arylsulfatase A-like enzyme